VSTWVSWETAAPGVMVEVDDEVEAGAPPWQATLGEAPVAADERAESAPRPLRVSPSIHPRHRRLFRPA